MFPCPRFFVLTFLLNDCARRCYSLFHGLSKTNLNRIASGLFVACELKEFACLESEHVADEIRRELLESVLKLDDESVVEAARGLDFVLGVGKLALQFDEVRIRLQVRIAFGYRKKRFQSACKHVFRGRVVSNGLCTHRLRERDESIVGPNSPYTD